MGGNVAMLKYLRFAVTALSLTTCVLLVALWVRSYFWRDIASVISPAGREYVLGSFRGIVSYASVGIPNTPSSLMWNYECRPTDQVGHVLSIHRPEYKVFGFAYRGTGGLRIVLPYWIPTFMTAALAVLPWLIWSTRFSLRTLLITTTLVAVVLGVIISTS
jgi:hypothetical protein